MLFFQTSSLSAFEVILLMKVEKKFKAACTVNYITELFYNESMSMMMLAR